MLARLKDRLGPLLWGTLIVFAVFRLGDLANLVFRFYMGHVLPGMEFGALDPAFAAVAFLGFPIIVVFQVAVKSISRMHAKRQDAEWRALVRDMMGIAAIGSVLVMAAVFASRDVLMRWLHLDESFFPVVLVLSVLMWWQPMYGSVLQGGRDYRKMGVYVLSGGVVLLLAGKVLVADLGLGLFGALWSKVLSLLVPTVLGSILLGSSLRGARSSYPKEKALMLGMLFPMSVFTLCTWILLHSDKLFVRRFLVEYSGGYAAVSALGTVPFFFIGALVFVLFPTAAADHASGGSESKRVWRHALVFAGSLGILCVSGLYLFADLVMGLWNAEFADYSSLVWVYALAMGMLGIAQVIASIQMARHNYGFLYYLALPCIAFLCILFFYRQDLTMRSVIWLLAACDFAALTGMTLHLFFSARRRA